jgi:hypothetical protein
MSASHEAIVERLRAIEEELRDLAYDRLRDSLENTAVLAEERRLHQARRAIEKAIHLLSPDGADTEPEG